MALWRMRGAVARGQSRCPDGPAWSGCLTLDALLAFWKGVIDARSQAYCVLLEGDHWEIGSCQDLTWYLTHLPVVSVGFCTWWVLHALLSLHPDYIPSQVSTCTSRYLQLPCLTRRQVGLRQRHAIEHALRGLIDSGVNSQSSE